MPERVAATRTGLAIALAYTLPLVIWLLGQAFLSSASQTSLASLLRGMPATLLLLQSCALAIGLPWLLRFPLWPDRCCAVAMLLLVPAPLYAISSLAGPGGGTGLVPAVSALAVLALLLHAIYAACLKLTTAGQRREILIVCVQFFLVTLCWQNRHHWETVLML
jgi:hypothetical protein